MQYSNRIRMDATGDKTSDLRCPRCDGNYLHQQGVTIYERGEDAAALTKISIGEDSSVRVAVVPSAGSGSPSARRHGMAINFMCEACNMNDRSIVIELTIAQHKGNTEMGWRFTPLPPSAS
ncbi:hypothetical protein [Sinorhizobium meliloti]|uniref:hypothetical protein n=1 Tax=Rhizobium meliloti TaxID=382 RepID=UPI000B49F06F|nr:hypothetical protein [Sinorhizobium meliloti]ASP55441.1 hypothetical protein CDO31_29275 [Sinorhizobium meliloti]